MVTRGLRLPYHFGKVTPAEGICKRDAEGNPTMQAMYIWRALVLQMQKTAVMVART